MADARTIQLMKVLDSVEVAKAASIRCVLCGSFSFAMSCRECQTRLVHALQSKVTVQHDKNISYWPYCEQCHRPFRFEAERPFAYCDCGTSEWGYPRPYSWVQEPHKNFCGCCGRFNADESWCSDCKHHTADNGPIEERTFKAQTGIECPHAT